MVGRVFASSDFCHGVDHSGGMGVTRQLAAKTDKHVGQIKGHKAAYLIGDIGDNLLVFFLEFT